MTDDSQHLKWRMEMVWKHKPCMCPNHLVQWYTFKTGYSCRWGDKLLLWFKRGTMRKPKGKRPKGKGFSFHPMTRYRRWMLNN
jgi:hypothetical protein